MGLVGLFVFPSSNSFSCWAVKLTTLSLLKLSEHYPNLDCLLLLFTSVSSYDIFMVYFRFQSYLGLLRISSTQILNISKDGDSTAPLGNLFQCSAALSV